MFFRNNFLIKLRRPELLQLIMSFVPFAIPNGSLPSSAALEEISPYKLLSPYLSQLLLPTIDILLGFLLQQTTTRDNQGFECPTGEQEGFPCDSYERK